MKVLSLFDGMACGMIAMSGAGISVERYVAYEIDKYATQTASHNFPMIEQKGDVFQADFTEYSDFDFLIGGSPCTYWSIAQTNNRETEASGMGWELFSQYVRALHEAKPRFFVYENNKSMSKAIRDSIDKAFGFEAICINSALVSAQNRQRLYWVGKRNEDGTYSRVPIDQPEDRGILLKDMLECGHALKEKQGTIDANYYKGGNYSNPNKQSGQRMTVAEPVAMRQVGRRINENGHRDDYNETLEHIQRYEVNENPQKTNCLTTVQKDNMVAIPVNVCGDKSHTLKAQYYKNGVANFVTNGGYDATAVAEPVCVAERGRYTEDGSIEQRLEAREDGKTNTLTTVQKDNNVAEPVRVGALPRPNGELSTSQAFRVYSVEGKSVNLTAQGGGAGGKKGLYAIPVEFDGEIPTKATSGADGKTYPVYEVKDGKITIKGKQYPIKLADGYYIIRKLTVRECMRLQTVPEWYEFPVSDSQAYKMLGNGWTVEVIVHLLKGAIATIDEDADDPFVVLEEVEAIRRELEAPVEEAEEEEPVVEEPTPTIDPEKEQMRNMLLDVAKVFGEMAQHILEVCK